MNKPSFLLWLSVKVEGKKRVRFAFPLFLPAFLMLADEAEDLLLFLNLVSFGRLRQTNFFKYGMWGIGIAFSLFDEMVFHMGPCDFIDINKDGVRVSFKLI